MHAVPISPCEYTRKGSSHANPATPRLRLEYDVIVRRDVPVPVRDGVRLAADLYLPARDGLPAPGRFFLAENAVYHDPERPSQVVLPIVSGSGQTPNPASRPEA